MKASKDSKRLFVATVPLLLLATGCQEPNDRTEIVGNGQGGIILHRVPKDPSDTPDAPRTGDTKSGIEQRVEVLEATVLRQQEQIAELHRQLIAKSVSTTSP
jgi:hypothetical protein